MASGSGRFKRYNALRSSTSASKRRKSLSKSAKRWLESGEDLPF